MGQESETQADSNIHYSISFDLAANHYIHVDATIPDAEPGQVVFMPVWTPGSYLVREYARHVDSVRASDSDGEEISIAKVNKNRWKLSNETAQTVVVSYRIYCNEMSVRTNFVDDEFALLNGAAVFLTCDSRLSEEHVVTLNMPESWRQSVTSLERRVALGANTFVANDFDELVDSPIVAGNPTLHAFTVGDVEHFLVNQGGDGLWDGEKAAADVAKIVQVHQDMWGQVPYDRYFFLNVIAEAGGGLEHDNSTVMLTSRWSYRDPKRYKSWLGLVSHEFFHTWNVRRLRPKALANYAYEVENYFEELWVAEGVTSYYDDLALARAGHSTIKEYLAALSKQIKTLQTTDGRFKQSLAQASHDAWIKFYRPNENSRNTSISYYNKGAIVAMLLDIEIRKATDNEKSLDDVMRALYADFALGEGYTTAEVVAEVDRQTGGDWEEWFDRTIYSTEELDYSTALDYLGLRFSDDAKEEAKKDSGEVDASEAEDTVASKKSSSTPLWTGLSSKLTDGKLVVSAVTEGSPAFKAGINVDDEIIAVNNYRTTSSMTEQLKQFREDGSADILLARRGALLTLQLPLVNRTAKTWKIVSVKEPTEQQKANLAAWLHQEVEEESE
ncbi:MAG: PDZ domain-containing protein [Aureliella sp.]